MALRLRWRKIQRRPTAIRLPPPAQRGTLLRTDLPERALSPEHQDRLFNLPRITTVTRTTTLSYRSRAIMGGGRKASIVWFPFGLARWGYWCEPASYHRLSCGVGGRD